MRRRQQRRRKRSATGGGKKIALLLPEHTTARYETQDRPNFVNEVKQLCPDCTVIYENANQDASEQQSQADSVLTQGVDAMVLDPVDAQSASAIVAKAKAQNVPVVSYDRLVSNADLDAYISFDNAARREAAGDGAGEQARAGRRARRARS